MKKPKWKNNKSRNWWIYWLGLSKEVIVSIICWIELFVLQTWIQSSRDILICTTIEQ